MGQRICIYTNDVEIITGKSNRNSQELLRKLKKEKGKEPHQLVSYCEFAEFMGLKPAIVFKTINRIPVLDEEE